MIPFRRVTSGPPTVTPPRRPVVIPAEYACAACECTGRGDRCWCCGKAMGEGA